MTSFQLIPGTNTALYALRHSPDDRDRGKYNAFFPSHNLKKVYSHVLIIFLYLFAKEVNNILYSDKSENRNTEECVYL